MGNCSSDTESKKGKTPLPQKQVNIPVQYTPDDTQHNANQVHYSPINTEDSYQMHKQNMSTYGNINPLGFIGNVIPGVPVDHFSQGAPIMDSILESKNANLRNENEQLRAKIDTLEKQEQITSSINQHFVEYQENNGWGVFENKLQKPIFDEWKKGMQTFTYTACNNNSYIIDFRTLTQRNTMTNFVRKIRIFDPNLKNWIQNKSFVQYEHNGYWVAADASYTSLVIAANHSKHNLISVKLNGINYYVDLVKMTQTNTRTNFTRRIRIV
jgi:WWE domain